MAEIKEECGVFGIYDLDGNDVTSSIYYGLTSLAAPWSGGLRTSSIRYQGTHWKCEISQGSGTGK